MGGPVFGYNRRRGVTRNMRRRETGVARILIGSDRWKSNWGTFFISGWVGWVYRAWSLTARIPARGVGADYADPK